MKKIFFAALMSLPVGLSSAQAMDRYWFLAYQSVFQGGMTRQPLEVQKISREVQTDANVQNSLEEDQIEKKYTNILHKEGHTRDILSHVMTLCDTGEIFTLMQVNENFYESVTTVLNASLKSDPLDKKTHLESQREYIKNEHLRKLVYKLSSIMNEKFSKSSQEEEMLLRTEHIVAHSLRFPNMKYPFLVNGNVFLNDCSVYMIQKYNKSVNWCVNNLSFETYKKYKSILDECMYQISFDLNMIKQSFQTIIAMNHADASCTVFDSIVGVMPPRKVEILTLRNDSRDEKITNFFVGTGFDCLKFLTLEAVKLSQFDINFINKLPLYELKMNQISLKENPTNILNNKNIQKFSFDCSLDIAYPSDITHLVLSQSANGRDIGSNLLAINSLKKLEDLTFSIHSNEVSWGQKNFYWPTVKRLKIKAKERSILPILSAVQDNNLEKLEIDCIDKNRITLLDDLLKNEIFIAILSKTHHFKMEKDCYSYDSLIMLEKISKTEGSCLKYYLINSELEHKKRSLNLDQKIEMAIMKNKEIIENKKRDIFGIKYRFIRYRFKEYLTKQM